MMSNNIITMTIDYKLKVNGKIVDQWDEETIRVALLLNLSLHSLNETSWGALFAGRLAIHNAFGKWKTQVDFDRLFLEGFEGTIEDLNNVCHLDDNLKNVKLSNLMNLPSQWNLAFIKPKGGILNGLHKAQGRNS